MSMNLANVTLIGRLARDPERRESEDGKSRALFTLAVNTKKRDDEHVDFYTCTAFARTGEFILQHAHKGDAMAVTGAQLLGLWTDKGGEPHPKADVTVDRAELLASKPQ